MLILRPPRTSQPQQRVTVSELALSLGLWSLAVATARGVATFGPAQSEVGAPGVSAQGGLVGWNLNGSTQHVDLGTPPAAADSVSILVTARQGSTVNAFPISTRSSGASEGIEIIVGPSSAVGQAALRVGTASDSHDTTLSPATGLDDGRHHTHVATWGRFAGTARHFVDGRLAGSVATTGGTITHSQSLRIGLRGSTYFAGQVALAAFFTRTLPASVAAELSRNPWQLFAPEPRRLWVPSAAPATPVLSAATALNITTTTADLRVTVTI